MTTWIHREMTAAPAHPPRHELGFALRKRLQSLADSWRQTVTHYKPQPWLVALDRDGTGLPFKPGRRPAANR